MRSKVGWTIASVLWLPVAIALVLLGFGLLMSFGGGGSLQMDMGGDPPRETGAGLPDAEILGEFQLQAVPADGRDAAYVYVGWREHPEDSGSLALRMRTTPAGVAGLIAALRQTPELGPLPDQVRDDLQQGGMPCPVGSGPEVTVYTADFTTTSLAGDALDGSTTVVVDRSDRAHPLVCIESSV